MKRFIIFVAIGPLIGVTVLLVAASASTDWALSASLALHFMGAAFLAYLLGLGPMLLVAVLDWWLERKGAAYRMAWCALVGFLACWLLGQNFTNAPWHFLAAAGIAGAISAAACSWLSGMNTQQRTM